MDKSFLNGYSKKLEESKERIYRTIRDNPKLNAVKHTRRGISTLSMIYPNLSHAEIIYILDGLESKECRYTPRIDYNHLCCSSRKDKLVELLDTFKELISIDDRQWLSSILSRLDLNTAMIVCGRDNFKKLNSLHLNNTLNNLCNYVEHNDLKVYNIIYNMMKAGHTFNEISEELCVSSKLVNGIVNENSLRYKNNYIVPPEAIEIGRKVTFHGLLQCRHHFGFSKIHVWVNNEITIDHGVGVELPKSKKRFVLGGKSAQLNNIPAVNVEIFNDRNMTYSARLNKTSALENLLLFSKLASLFHANNRMNISSTDERAEHILSLDFITSSQIMELMCHYGGADEVVDYLVSYNNLLRTMAASPLVMGTGTTSMYMDNWGLYRASIEDTHRCSIPNTKDIESLMKYNRNVKTILDPCAFSLTTAIWCRKNDVKYRWYECVQGFEKMMNRAFPNEQWYKKYSADDVIDLVVDTNIVPIQWIIELSPTNVKCAQLHKDGTKVSEAVCGHKTTTIKDKLTGCTWIMFESKHEQRI